MCTGDVSTLPGDDAFTYVAAVVQLLTLRDPLDVFNSMELRPENLLFCKESTRSPHNVSPPLFMKRAKAFP